MNYFLSVACSLSIAIAACIAAWRFGAVHRIFRPFIYLCWLGCLNELLSLALTTFHHSNAINSNIYVLLESFLIVWQFQVWGVFSRYPAVLKLLIGLLLLTWTIENFIISRIIQFNSWFRVLYSFVIVLLAIIMLNRQLVRERGVLLKNPVILICLGFIIYYTYKILVETFWLYGLAESPIFQIRIYFILDCINLFSNLIYALAVLWMPTKHRFTLRY